MMRANKLALLAGILLVAISPVFSQKGIKGMINAEKEFAAFTASHSIREGFLKYMDSAGVIFNSSGQILNAQEIYQKQKPSAGVLSWTPAFALISASGDLGVTTGPYEYRLKSASDTVAEKGSFTSVWHIDQQGNWKNLVDLGVSYTAKYPLPKEVKEISLPKAKELSNSYEHVLVLDEKFNNTLEDKSIRGWQNGLAPDSWLNIEGELPAVGFEQVDAALRHIPVALLLVSRGGNVSSSGEFVYIYGTIEDKHKIGNYLRIWAYREKKWQVVLQVLKW